MTSQFEEVLKHRYIYVPRGTEKDTIQPGKRLGLAVARSTAPTSRSSRPARTRPATTPSSPNWRS